MQESAANPVLNGVARPGEGSSPPPSDAARCPEVTADDTDAAMLAATALGLSIVRRAGAVGTLRGLAESRISALLQARARLAEFRDVDESAVLQARSLLSAAAKEAELAGQPWAQATGRVR